MVTQIRIFLEVSVVIPGKRKTSKLEGRITEITQSEE